MTTSVARKRWLVAAAALPVLAVAALYLWLAYTAQGLARLASWLETLDAVDLRLEGLQGRLAGPLHVDALTLGTERVSVRVEDLDLDHHLSSLFFGRAALRELRAGSVLVSVAPSSAPPRDGPLQFLPSWLSVGLGEGQIDRLGVELPNGTRLDFTDVSAEGRITASRIRLRRAALDAGIWTARGSVTLVAREPLRIEGDVEWTVRTRPELSGTLRAKGDLARLYGAVGLQGPSAATAEVVLSGLDARPEWEARVEAVDFDLSPWIGTPPVGPLSGFVSGRGSFERFGLDGHLAGAGLPPEGVNLAGQLQRSPDALVFESARLSTPDDRTVLIGNGSLQLGDDPALQLHGEWTGLGWPVDGRPVVSSRKGTLQLHGWGAFDVEADAFVAMQGVPETRVLAAGLAGRSGITVTRAQLQGPAGEAEAIGYVGFQAELPWQLDGSIRRLDLGRFQEGLDSRLTFDLSGSGLGFGEDSAWAVQVGPVSGTFRGYTAAGAGFILHERGGYRFRDVGLELGPARARLDGRLGGETNLDARIDVPDLSGLHPQAGGLLEGHATLASVRDPTTGLPVLRLDTSLRGRDLRWGEQRAAVLSADADVDLDGLARSWVRLRAAGLTVGGQSVSSLRVSLDGLAGAHDFALRVGAGDRATELVGAGAYDAGEYRLTADRFVTDAPRLEPYQLEEPMQLSVSGAEASLQETCFVFPPRRICLAGHWQRDLGWSANVDVSALPLEALRIDMPRQPGYRGRLDLSLHASQEGDQPWTASARGALQDAFLLYRTPSGRAEELNLGVTRLDLHSGPDRHELTLATEDSSALQLKAQATLGRIEGVALGDSPLQGRLFLSTRRLGLLPLLVPEVDKAEGDLRAELTVEGTPSRPMAGGTVLLDVDALDFYATNLRLREAVARFTLLETGLRLESEGKAGEGSYQTTGELGWRDGVLRGELRLQGERLLVADVPEARVEASPDLTFRIDDHDIEMQGEVRIPKARIEPKQLVGAVTVSPDVRMVDEQEDEEEPDPWRVKAGVRLTLGRDVQLQAFGLKGRLEGTMLTRLRPDEVTTASGELEIQDGKYLAYSKELDVDRGRLLFAGGPVTDPGVDLRASKTVPGYKVGVAVRGRLRRPEISLYSDPAMPQSQIASLLLVGRRLDNLDLNDRQSLGGSSGDMAAQGGAVLAGQLGRYVGLDEISYETDAETDESELVLGKFLSPRLYVSYGISLSDAINTFKARYTIGDRWVISGEAGQEASADIEYTIDR